LAVALPIAALADRSGAGFRPLQLAGWTALGFASIVVLFALLRDAFTVSSRVSRWLWRKVSAAGAPPAPIDPERRAFMTNAVNMGIVGSASMITGAGTIGIHSAPEVVEVEVPIEDLHEDLDGFTIAQLTDIHIGPTIKGDYMRTLVDATNALGADMIAVTGDLVDGHVPDLREHVAPLADLEAPHGTYFVTGNHEYYWDGPAWVDEVRRLGVDALINEHRVIQRGRGTLTVAGVTDHRASRHVSTHRSDPEAALAGAPADSFKLLLAHQPRSIYAAQRAGFDLQLSGHTHGGQYFPFSVLVYLTQPYVAGLHLAANTWIYVSRGSAYWGPPVRVGAPREITLLRLVRARA
jgi:predicted MPP superfamily phosphohydrolase